MGINCWNWLVIGGPKKEVESLLFGIADPANDKPISFDRVSPIDVYSFTPKLAIKRWGVEAEPSDILLTVLDREGGRVEAYFSFATRDRAPLPIYQTLMEGRTDLDLRAIWVDPVFDRSGVFTIANWSFEQRLIDLKGVRFNVMKTELVDAAAAEIEICSVFNEVVPKLPKIDAWPQPTQANPLASP